MHRNLHNNLLRSCTKQAKTKLLESHTRLATLSEYETMANARLSTEAQGFSLLELLTTLTIIALLASFAVPSWKSHLLTARRTEATSLIMQIAMRQEQFRREHHRYASSDEIADPHPAGLGITAQNNNYALALTASRSAFSATTTVNSRGSQANDAVCHSFGINESGHFWSTNARGADTTRKCWRN
jgi:type IV pilus assembly protein PilE